MIDSLLHLRLRPVLDRQRRARLWFRIALVWLAAAIAGWLILWLQRQGTPGPHTLLPWLVIAALAATAGCWLFDKITTPNVRRLAQRLEARHPELNGRLLTAIQQQPDKKGDYSFLQERLFEDAVRHSVDYPWESVTPAWAINAGRAATAAGVAACLAAALQFQPPAIIPLLASTTGGETTADGLTITPGDTSLEKGSTLTVMARFDKDVPASADLVIGATAASERRLPLVRGLADPVFGGTVAEVSEPFTYRIDYNGRRTRDFKVSVYEHPRLERSDIELTPPAYTGQPPQRIEDTRRVSAVEGTKLSVFLQLNKPVATATLVPRDEKAAPVALATDPARAAATLADFPLTTSQSYELRLVDADGRSNKTPDLFVFEALPNRPPELKLASPRGDLRPSALEEVDFNGTAWDDFGVLAFGIGLGRGGEEPKLIELGRDVPAKEKSTFKHLLQLEALGAKPDELYSWFLWADDIGPDGQRRRTQGDLFFGEVRPFEEIFREGAGMAGEQPPGEQGEQQQGSPATQLAELQKQIINATWKLQRSQPGGETYVKDAEVVRDSQVQAKAQAQEVAAAVEEPMRAALWTSVTGEMEKALERLDRALKSPAVLPEALVAGQSAYQALLKLRERETEVSRGQPPQQGQASAGEQQRQEQLEELELEEAENRYQNQRQAQSQQSAERRAQMQVQNRLQELAQRQQDVNEKLQELQTALQAAASEEEREELRRQLKRLEEEQRQMLADMDELGQRMDRPETQAQMAEQRQQLEQTRQDAQRAAEAAAQGEVAEALAAGTRAERQLQEMREQMRRESAGQLAEELRQMRAEARDLARQQESITESLAGKEPEAPQRPSLSDSPAEEKVLEELKAQQERTAELVTRATRLSDEAEGSEPLVSRQLYDTVRQFSQEDATTVKRAREQLIQDGEMTQDLYRQLQQLQESTEAGQALSLTSELLRAELPSPAQQAAQQAEAGLGQLRAGVEEAAEKVLGDDTAALQAAAQELEALAEELAREAAAAQGRSAGDQTTQGPGESGPQSADARQGEAGQQGQESQGSQAAAGESNESPADAGAETGQPGGERGQGGQGRQGRQESTAQAGAGQSGEPQEGSPQPGTEPAETGPPEGQGGQGGGAPSGARQASAQPGGGNPSDPSDRTDPSEATGEAGGGGGGARSGRQPGGQGESVVDRVAQSWSGESGATGGRGGGSPIAGEGFTEWSDRLREVEEMIEFPDLRTAVASARERARVLRQEAKRDLKKPDWAVVELEILSPLVEVRQQVREELRRRSAEDPLAPIDRDPVPERFAELVRRYYEELGRDP
jgi:hypothetical protein